MGYTNISAKVPVLKNGVHIMTCDFGPRTYTLNGKKVSDNHKGVDLIGKGNACDYVIAAADGTVTIAKYSSSAGYYVQLNHGNGVYTRYLHMKANSLTVKVGQKVTKGTVLGYMGSTGQSTGAHLHFDITVNGQYVDPKPYLAGTKAIIAASSSASTNNLDVIYQVYAGGKWWPEVTNYNEINSNGYAGVYGKEISGIRVRLSNGATVTVSSHTQGKGTGDWLPPVTKWDDTSNGYSGVKGKPIDGIAMKASGATLKYRVHTKNGKWLPWVTKYNLTDSTNGFAGIYGKSIDAVQIDV